MTNQTTLGNGYYTVSEAARYLSINKRKLRRWFFGKPSERSSGSIISADYQPIDNSYALSFYDLIGAYVMKILLEKGARIPTIRKAHTILQEELGLEHPFCHIELKVMGREVLAQVANKIGKQDFYDIIHSQLFFPHFYAGLEKLEYDKIHKLVNQMNISRGIRINPQIAFGKPVIDGTSTTSRIIAKSYIANNENKKLVAELFNIRTLDVTFAIGTSEKHWYLTWILAILFLI